MTYGLEARLYPSFLKTTWSAGWRHEDKERDLTYGVVPALAPPISLYGESYSADEIYLKMVSRPARGWIVRVTPSYLWASETGLTATDPNEMFKLKTSVAYTKPDWNELAVTGYYNYTYKMNDSLSYSNYNLNPPGFASPQNQETTNTMQAFGVNMSLVPAEELKVTLGYDWNQNDLSAYYFATNRLRFDYPLAFPGVPNPHPNVPLDFAILDQTNYNVDNHTVSAGIEKQWNRYVLMGSYSLNWANGHNANGLAGQELPTVDGTVDNLLHSFALGLEYSLKKDTSVRGVYFYDRYNDKVYDSLSGSRNTIWLGLNYRL
jgi:predicted porin